VSAYLDSWAILAWLDGEEPVLSRVEELLESRPVASWVNLVEVYCRVERDHGRAAADETLASLRASLAPDLPGTARMIEVARLKARAAIALGDCFAVTTAAAHGLMLLTGDPEILDVADPPCRVEDPRG
jgi:PIN domain nuclease of toxin-antitoxin system